jgi:hypothetical protein
MPDETTGCPRIFLALDNCFASKRWTTPDEWMAIAAEMGVYAIEASADNECDPLYSPPEALREWIEEVKAASARTGVRVVNFYSGHGTYTTLGLGHPDARVRDHIQHNWLEPMIRSAAALEAGLGFFCHAFPQAALYDPAKYAQAENDLFDRLAALAALAGQVGLRGLSVEQMYSPHQPPWTINGARRFLAEVTRRAGAPLYITLDTGHHTGQRLYRRPDAGQIAAYAEAARRGETAPDAWMGGAPGGSADEVAAYIAARPHLFAEESDGDLYGWLRALGRCSPIIHLQQTDGSASKHQPFTPAFNAGGQVRPEWVLAALKESFEAADDSPDGLPPCREIYLTLELFSGTAERPAQILSNIRQSVIYWRQFIPEDGLPLDQLA